VGRLGCRLGRPAGAEHVAGLARELARIRCPLPAGIGRTRRPAAEGSRACGGEVQEVVAPAEVGVA